MEICRSDDCHSASYCNFVLQRGRRLVRGVYAQVLDVLIHSRRVTGGYEHDVPGFCFFTMASAHHAYCIPSCNGSHCRCRHQRRYRKVQQGDDAASFRHCSWHCHIFHDFAGSKGRSGIPFQAGLLQDNGKGLCCRARAGVLFAFDRFRYHYDIRLLCEQEGECNVPKYCNGCFRPFVCPYRRSCHNACSVCIRT